MGFSVLHIIGAYQTAGMSRIDISGPHQFRGPPQMNIIGKRVEWELSGRGRGTIQQGEVVHYVPSGKTNKEALEELAEKRPDLRIRPKYCRFALDTYRTERVMVLVEQPSKRVNKTYWIYAPNVLEIAPV